ncbi:hypothetical protein B0H16DRAFT_383252 [Mycena metata]|uniref:Uncharacterized protein n=1 Tax=Mycena metata TaxID=1033252 RepID=A0AAD7HH13_9AGAR|nr:hypothetical protein B0H16DRAFT_383252 [Mycena metata]
MPPKRRNATPAADAPQKRTRLADAAQVLASPEHGSAEPDETEDQTPEDGDDSPVATEVVVPEDDSATVSATDSNVPAASGDADSNTAPSSNSEFLSKLEALGLDISVLQALPTAALVVMYETITKQKLASPTVSAAENGKAASHLDPDAPAQELTSRSDATKTGSVPPATSQLSIASSIAGAASDRVNALQTITAIGVDGDRVAGWSAKDLKRLAVLVTFVDDTQRRYAIDHAPNGKDWGVPAPFDNQANTICASGTSKPLEFWIVGEIAGQWWYDTKGFSPADRPGISVQPMVSSVPEFCKRMLTELCMPANHSNWAEQFGVQQVKASRWMNARTQGGQVTQATEFKAVYDARQALRDKSQLQPLSVSQLKIHDIVVLEVRVTRYAVQAEGTPVVKGRRRPMDRWQVYYDLQAVYKIKDAIATEQVAAPVVEFTL